MRVLASPALINRWWNPYNWLLNTHLEREGVEVFGAAPWRVLRAQGDIWHVHWPEHGFNGKSAARAAWRARTQLHMAREGKRLGIKLVWTVHNLRAHDGRHAELEETFWRDFLDEVDGFVHLSRSGQAAAEARFPQIAGRPSWVIPHGHYRGEYVTTRSRAASRDVLGLDQSAPVVLFSGRIRPYKNVPALLRAFHGVNDRQARCVITGSPASAALRDEIEMLARRDSRVLLQLRHLRQKELASTLNASDLVVLPYREILNSGSALLALSLGRPVLVPRLGALAELADAVGTDWVRCFDGELTSTALSDAIVWARETPRRALAPLDAFAWPAIARAHHDAYRALCADAPHATAPRELSRTS